MNGKTPKKIVLRLGEKQWFKIFPPLFCFYLLVALALFLCLLLTSALCY